jgi:hypothetical protein
VCPHEDFIRYAMPSSKLCVVESILGSDCISYTLAYHVDGLGKLHPGAIHSDDCCGENCVDSRGVVWQNLDLHLQGCCKYIGRKLDTQYCCELGRPWKCLASTSNLRLILITSVSSSQPSPHISKVEFGSGPRSHQTVIPDSG